MQRIRVSSQSISVVFRWVCSLLLIPGVPVALLGFAFTLTVDGLGVPDDPMAAAHRRWLTAITIPISLAAGCMLLWGYRRHARGEDVWGGSVLLWLLTVLYNGAPLGWVLSVELSPFEIPWPLTLLILWWLAAVVLALIAATLDVRARLRGDPAP